MIISVIQENKTVISNLNDLGTLAKELLIFAGDCKFFAFFAEMGAGKTTFIRHICREIGVTENVSSPTFSLINEYHYKTGGKVFHFDFYRIKKEEEAIEIGCEEYFESGSLCLVEWPEKILNLLPHPYVKISIEIKDQQRIFTFSYD